MEAVQHMKAQAVPGCPFIFATQTREHVSYRYLLKTMVLASKVAGVEKRGIHALRHSYASNLYARGVEVKIISKLLGHASVEITYNQYIHFFEKDIDDTLRQAVGGVKWDREWRTAFAEGRSCPPFLIVAYLHGLLSKETCHSAPPSVLASVGPGAGATSEF